MIPKRVAIVGTDSPDYELYCPNWIGMMDGLKRLSIEGAFFTCRPRLDVAALAAFDPDLIVYGLLDMVRNPELRREVRAALPNARIVLWYGDLRNRQTGQIAGNLSDIDAMFVSNDAQAAWYERIWKVPHCFYLPLGSPIFDRDVNPRLSFDFVFIGGRIFGQTFADRAGTIGKYEREAGLKVIDGPMDRPELRMKVFKAMPQIYRSAKIVLDQSHFTDIARYTSNRHWIITGSGGFALTKRFPGCELDYPEGTRAYFDTFEESLELVRYYLKHDDEREKIRLAGFEHAKKFHTYDHRFRRMFELLSEI